MILQNDESSSDSSVATQTERGAAGVVAPLPHESIVGVLALTFQRACRPLERAVQVRTSRASRPGPGGRRLEAITTRTGCGDGLVTRGGGGQSRFGCESRQAHDA